MHKPRNEITFQILKFNPIPQLYDSICQIPFDRFRDQLQLETVQNGTAVKIGKKRESVYEALGYLKFIFACVALFY